MASSLKPTSRTPSPDLPRDYVERKERGPGPAGVGSIVARSIASGHTGLSPDLLDRVARLELDESAGPLLRETSDPVEFFQNFKVEKIKDWFKKEDIDHLNVLMRSHLLSNRICFHDLFGLEFSRLLENLKDFLPAEKWEELKEEWRSLYLTGYFGLFRLIKNGINTSLTKDTNETFLMAWAYLQKFEQFSKKVSVELDRARILKESGGSKTKKDLIAKLYKPVPGILKEWEAAKTVFFKFLAHRQVDELLIGEPLTACPGNLRMCPASRDEVGMAIDNLCRYATLMSESQRAAKAQGKVGLHYEILDDSMRRIAALSKIKGKEKILRAIQGIFQAISEASGLILDRLSYFAHQINEAREGRLNYSDWCQQQTVRRMEDKTKEEFIEFLLKLYIQTSLALTWTQDIQTILELSVIKIIDPAQKASKAYINRMSVALEAIIPSILTIQSEDQGDQPLDLELRKLKIPFFQFFNDSGISRAISSLLKMRADNFACSAAVEEVLRQIYPPLKKIVAQTLIEISKLKEKYGDQWVKAPLLEKTLWLSRILIFFNDIGIILREKEARPDDEETLPLPFLEFLALEYTPEPSPRDALDQSPVPVSFGPSLEVAPANPPISPTVSDGLPPRTLSQVSEVPSPLLPRAISLSAPPASDPVAAAAKLTASVPVAAAPKLPDSVPVEASPKPPSPDSDLLPVFSGAPHARPSRPAPQPQRHDTPLSETASIAEQLRSGTAGKKRLITNILRALGLRQVESATGPHELWENEDGTLRTGVGRHSVINPIPIYDDIKRGLAAAAAASAPAAAPAAASASKTKKSRRKKEKV